MKSMTSAAAGLAILLLAGGTAAAQTGPRSAIQFDAIDRSADGFIDVREATDYRERLFRTIDLDSKGSITLEEWLTATKSSADTPDGRQIAEQFQAADGDADGKITLREMLQAGESRFRDLDKDGDGRLARDEYHTSGL